MTLRGELLKIAAARIVMANTGVEKKAWVQTALFALPMILPLLQNVFKSQSTRQQETMDRRMGVMQSRMQLQQMEKAKLDNINRWKVKGFYNPLAQNNQQNGGMRSMFGVNMPFFGGGATGTSPSSGSNNNTTGGSIGGAFAPNKNLVGNFRNMLAQTRHQAGRG